MALTSDPYSQYRLGPQQNVNNAQSGQAGQYSDKAIQNANAQSQTKGNPFADFLTHVQTINQYKNNLNGMAQQASSMAQTPNPMLNTTSQGLTPGNTDPVSVDQGGASPGGQRFLPGNGGSPINPITPTQTGNGTTQDITQVAGTGVNGNTTTTGTVQQINPSTGKPYGMPPPQGVDPALWNDADRYVQAAKAQGQDYSFLYQHPEWISDFRNWDAQNHVGGKVDIVDWLKATHPEVASGLAGRSGSDTYATWKQTNTVPQTTQGTTPTTVPSPTYTGGNPMSPFDLHGAYSNAFNDNLKQIQSLLQPQFDYQANQLNRNMAAQGAATGNINSGGYQESLGRAQAQLAGEQGAKISDYAMTASENAKNRALQEFTTRLQDDTQRYGINTNAQLQQWLESQKDALQKYGIDVDAFMKQYAANLQLKGQMYSADQSFNAQVFAQTLQYQLGLANVDADRERNLQQFILGYGQLNNGAIANVTGAINGTPPGNTFVQP